MWDHPNLVVDNRGYAQCLFCCGIGKEFCSDCEGSGSKLRKGFSLEDRYRIFDMFPESREITEDDIYDDEDDDEYEDDDEEDQDSDEEEDEYEYSIYRGSPKDVALRGDGLRSRRRILTRDDDDLEEEEVADGDSELIAGLSDVELNASGSSVLQNVIDDDIDDNEDDLSNIPDGDAVDNVNDVDIDVSNDINENLVSARHYEDTVGSSRSGEDFMDDLSEEFEGNIDEEDDDDGFVGVDDVDGEDSDGADKT